VEREEEATDMALGVVKARYSNVDPEGKAFSFDLWISFVFRRLNEEWKMVFVQNTRI